VSGQAQLTKKSSPVLSKINSVLKKHPNLFERSADEFQKNETTVVLTVDYFYPAIQRHV